MGVLSVPLAVLIVEFKFSLTRSRLSHILETVGLCWQVGHSSGKVMAESVGRVVLFNFRPADVSGAVGGSGNN